MGCIYKATNTITGKGYIGQTDDFERRKSEHINGRKEYDFNKAIRQYGADSFEWEILLDGIDDSKELDAAETKLIAEHSTLAPNGYNLLNGDHHQKHIGLYLERQRAGIKRVTSDPKWKAKHAEQLRRMHASPEWRRKHAAAMARNPQNPEWIRKHAEMVESLKKPVLCVETRQTHKSSKDAERATGIDSSSISKVCKGKRIIAGGYHWRYA